MRSSIAWSSAVVLCVAACGASGITGSGGVDNGQPQSTCHGVEQPLSKAPEAGTRAERFEGIYYEVGDPVPFRRAAPLMLVIHGGGWDGYGPGQVQSMRGEADHWRSLGWRTVNLDYRPCGQSVASVVGMYEQVRSLAAGHAVCAEGFSAGGHLALMLAVERPEIRCVMAFAAPTDLPAFLSERTSPTSVPLTGAATDVGPKYSYNLAVAAFGRARLVALSPALQAARVRARVLLAIATNDIFIPWAQASGFAAARPAGTSILRLPVGKLVFVHGTTTTAGLQMVARAERRLVAGLG